MERFEIFYRALKELLFERPFDDEEISEEEYEMWTDMENLECSMSEYLRSIK